MKDIRIRVCDGFHRDIKTWAAQNGMTIKAAVITAIREMMNRQGILFYCTRCGRRMWEEANWEHIKGETLETMLAGLVCSDCLLAEVRAAQPQPQEQPTEDEWQTLQWRPTKHKEEQGNG